jgi:hypothetical protein
MEVTNRILCCLLLIWVVRDVANCTATTTAAAADIYRF